MLKSRLTRFRAYQLGSAGSSFSYFDGTRFTLIEARLTDGNKESLKSELHLCETDKINTLHITSWDQDHCVPSQLEEIVQLYRPYKIEYPGYEPHTENGKECLRIIRSYKQGKASPKKLVQVTPEYIKSLDNAESYGYNNIFYHPKFIDPESPNNNSSVKQFRSGSFNVLSLGDVENTNIASGLRRQKTISSEVDVMILAHHGAANGFTTSIFMKHTHPSVAIASADYDNQFKHPKPEIRELLHKNKIRLFTTKTGDVVIFSTGNHTGNYRIVNLKSGSTEISSKCDFRAKKSKRLSVNQDTIRARIKGANRGPKRH